MDICPARTGGAHHCFCGMTSGDEEICCYCDTPKVKKPSLMDTIEDDGSCES